ncbi:MAG: biopolymer transport protein ExbD [Candidatus Paceibacteria bacterium]
MNLHELEAGDEPQMNLTPMIDVIFQLLIFFMVATTFQQDEREMDVELPPAASGTELTREDDEIIIHVKRDGALVIKGETYDQPALARHLAMAAERNPKTPVMIRGDRLVHHEDVIGVMDACGIAGLTSLSLGTLEAP